MRFYTGKLEGTQLLFAGFEKDPFLYRIEDYGMKFSDMTELVCTITDEQKDRLLNEREGKRAYALDEIQILQDGGSVCPFPEQSPFRSLLYECSSMG